MPNGMLDSILGVIVQVSVFLWIIGLAFSLLIKDHKKYLTLSQKHITAFVRKHWRYIIVFLIGYMMGYPGSVRLLIH